MKERRYKKRQAKKYLKALRDRTSGLVLAVEVPTFCFSSLINQRGVTVSGSWWSA